MARRLSRMTRLSSAVAAVAVAGGGLALASPAYAADCNDKDYKPATCPTAGPTAASAVVVIAYATGSNTVALQAAFNDPKGALRDSSVAFKITAPGVDRTVYPATAPVVQGSTKVYSATYTAYNFYKAGTYTVSASAGTYGNSSFAVTTTPTTFVVKHQTRITMTPSNYFPRMGQKVRFSGSFYPTIDAGGQKLKVMFKAKGTKKWVKKGKAVVKANGTYKTKKQTMAAYGKWRLKFKGSTYLLGSKVGMVYKKR